MIVKTIAKLVVTVALTASCQQAGAAESSAGGIESFKLVSVHDVFGGKTPHGAAGPYQLVRARVTGALDPNAAANAGIVDLDRAPRDARGRVIYRTDVVILRPKNARDAARTLVYDVVNRGGLLGRGTFIGGGDLVHGTPPDRDFPSWLEHGYTVVWSGWQGDLPLSSDELRLGTAFPQARIDGKPVTGMSREEYIPDTAGGPPHTFRLSYPPADPGDRASVRFTARESWRDGQGQEVYAGPAATVRTWHYVHRTDGPDGPRDEVAFTPPAQVPGLDGKPMVPDAGTIYSFVYRARGSRVDGIGFAAVRDLVGFLRRGGPDASGQRNPMADLRPPACQHRPCPGTQGDAFDTAIGIGISQSGRFLRDFLYRGFNDDSHGHRVFDGLMPIIAGARRTWVDTRFAQPGRWSKQHEDHFMHGFQFPFAYNVIDDPVSGRRDGLLRACQASRTCPKIMQFDGSFEWWNGAASLVVTDGAGHDLTLPDNVRYYVVPGTGHGGGGGITDGLMPARRADAMCQFADSPVSEAPFERALFARLVDWVRQDTPPPASRYPSVAAGTARAPGSAGFPLLAAATWPEAGDAVQTASVDFRGVHNTVAVTHFDQGVPSVDPRRSYTVLAPAVDATGNDLAGIRTPTVAVPLASYTGWNLRAAGHAEGELCTSHGAMFPLAVTDRRRSAGDPRPSLSQLYVDRADYIRKVDAASAALVQAGYLLKRDADRLYRARAAQVAASLFPSAGK